MNITMTTAMKFKSIKLIIISLVIILSSCDNDKNELKIIHSNTEKIKYSIMLLTGYIIMARLLAILP